MNKKLAANSTWRSSIGEFHVSHPNRIDQLHLPPGTVVTSVGDRTGVIIHMIAVHSFTCCVAASVCAALGGRAEQGEILAWRKNRYNNT